MNPIMRSLSMAFFSISLWVPSLSAGSTVYVCDRTPEVRDFILKATGKTCETVVPNDLSTITSIDLSFPDDQPVQLKAGDFSGLSEVVTLNVSGNVWIPGSEIADLPKLTDLSISGLPRPIDPDLIAGISALHTFALHSSQQQTLPENFFSTNLGIEKIELVENALTSLPPGLFQGLKKLQSVQVSEPLLNALPEGLLSNLPVLKSVQLKDGNTASRWRH